MGWIASSSRFYFYFFYFCSVWCLGVAVGAFGARRRCCKRGILSGLLCFRFFPVGCYRRRGTLCWFLVRCSSLRGCNDPPGDTRVVFPRVQGSCDLSNAGEKLELRGCSESCGITEAPVCVKQGLRGVSPCCAKRLERERFKLRCSLSRA